jgi:hypothetical protein
MKKLVALFVLFLFVVAYSNISAQTTDPKPPQHGKNFVDKNGDGYNDNAPDTDGDGIPNGVDPDYKGSKVQRNKFVDLNGDGINDNAGKGKRSGNKGYGQGAGKGNGKQAMGQQKGTGTGDCTETGTQGANGRGYRGGKK